MTREQILRSHLEMARHNLGSYSKGWSLDKPKEGYETEYKDTIEEIHLLETWLKEFHRSNSDSIVTYIGYLDSASYAPCYDGKTRANEIEFEVDTGAGFMYGDRRILKVGVEVQDWFIGESGSCCGRYDIEKDRRDSRKLRITVDTINVVRFIEWAEEEN